MNLRPPIALLAALPLAASVYDTAGLLDLLPAPREIRLSGARIDLGGWSIVTANGSAMLRAAAGEINARVADLGGAALPVRTGEVEGPAIVIGSAADAPVRTLAARFRLRLSAADPGEQGYLVSFPGGRNAPMALLAGSDEPGALYAAVTFRSLLERRNGRVVVRSAAVRDWPDFKLRCAGALTSTAPAEACREIDFYFRHKINCLAARRPPARQVVEYARARGILLRYGAGVEIGAAANASERAMAIPRAPGTLYLWGAWDAHRKAAARFAAALAGLPPGMVSVHPMDAGGYIDPEEWSRRAPAVAARYGDDRARASIEQFAAWFDAALRVAPGTLTEAVVYPYHFQFAVPGFGHKWRRLLQDGALAGMGRPIEDDTRASAIRRALSAYHAAMNAGLPPGAHVVFREAGRAEFDACAALYPGRPITIWAYLDRNNGWCGAFCPQVRFVKTFWRPERRDLFYAASSWGRFGDARVQRLAAVEYLWNVDRPDASGDFTTLDRSYERAGRVTGFQRRSLIPRICRILYGSAAQAIEPVIAANLSLHYISDPQGATAAEIDGEDFADPYRYFAEQTGALAKSRAALAAAAGPAAANWRERLDRVRPAAIPGHPAPGGEPLPAEVTRRNQTVTYGFATVLSFRLAPALDGPVEIRDAGGRLLAKVRPRNGRVVVDLGRVVSGALTVRTPTAFVVDEDGAVRTIARAMCSERYRSSGER